MFAPRKNLAQQEVDAERKRTLEQTIGPLRSDGSQNNIANVDPSQPVSGQPMGSPNGGQDPDGDPGNGANPDPDRDGDRDTMGNTLVPRTPRIEPQPGEQESADKIALFKGQALEGADAPEDVEAKARHSVLMGCLEEEAERQAEERRQAQIDHDYYDHQQWTHEEAKILQDRGQAPLVYNESRISIDWLAGTERKLRKDYRIRPREEGGEQMGEIKTKLFKYTDDVNLAAWHRSRAFKQAAISGLGWLEESITPDPERELIYSGSEDWRRVYRDSRGREFDQSDWRYIIRRKVVDLDYACAVLPKIANHLMAASGRWGVDDDEADDVWYLGQHLTAAHSLSHMQGNDGLMGPDWSVRRSGSGNFDHGRRNSVELLETYYRVPERVKVFADGPFFRKVMNPAHPGHVQAANDKTPMYETVKWRMRVMVSTRHVVGWDGASPFNHGQFTLIPMFGYRRGRDGMTYGAMRGMRDPQDDLNKRKSKALHLLSNNRITVSKNATDDFEELREEAARADGLMIVDQIANLRVEKPMAEASQNLEMAEADRIHIRNVSGVTNDNLGQESNAMSGKAIIAKQEQGSLTSFELFDNYYLAFKLGGQRRLANMEQFCNQPWTVRIDPEAAGVPEYHVVNTFDPRTGQYLNDITATQMDFIVDQQDWRATLSQAAMQSMFELLGNIANFAPQVVVSILDLVVESSDIVGKQEWVKRIRQINGQADPNKPPTLEDQARQQKAQQQQDEMNQANLDMAKAKVQELAGKIDKTNADKVLANLQGLLAAMQTVATAATMPGLAPAADLVAKSAGFVDETPDTPIIAPVQGVPPQGPPGAPPQLPGQPPQAPPQAPPGAPAIPSQPVA